MGLKRKDMKSEEDFNRYIADNYFRNIIQVKNSITIKEARDQLFILYQLLGGKKGIYTFDKKDNDDKEDITYTRLADIIYDNYKINILRVDGKRQTLKQLTEKVEYNK